MAKAIGDANPAFRIVMSRKGMALLIALAGLTVADNAVLLQCSIR